MHPGLSAWSCTMRNQKWYIYFFFFFSRLPGTKHLSSCSHSHLPAGWMEKGAEVGRCRASTGRGCTGVTVATAIKTGLRIKSAHRAPQTLARCDWVDRIYLFIFTFFHFFPPLLLDKDARDCYATQLTGLDMQDWTQNSRSTKSALQEKKHQITSSYWTVFKS